MNEHDPAAKQPDKPTQPTKILCPYCGHLQAFSDRCNMCGGPFEPLSRMATQIAMGPWFLRDTANPFKPGFSYSTLKKMIASGRISATTVMRGPTTHQFWAIARNVPGVSHMLGYCHACGKKVDKRERNCPHCMAAFRSIKDRDRLGLQYPTDTAVKRARQKLNEAMGITEPAEASGEQPLKHDVLDDLLSEDLGGSTTAPTGAAANTPALSSVPEGETATIAAGEPDAGGTGQPAPSPAQSSTDPSATPPPAQQPAAQPQPYMEDRPRPSAPISPIVWVLLILNVLFAAGVGSVVYLLYFANG